MTDLPILFSFRRCPYAMRARLALLVSGISVELREVVLRDKPAQMLAISPKATVPVLLLPNGQIIDESLAIMHWALAQHDPENWLAGNDEAQIATNDGPFKHALDRYKYPHRYDLPDGLHHRDQASAMLAALDARIAANEITGLTGNAIFPFIRQFAETDRTWFDAQPWPHLQNWLADHLASACFAIVMVRHPQWKIGGPPVLFPN